MKLNVGLVSFGFPNFRYDIAQTYLEKAFDWLNEKNINLTYFNEILIDESKVDEAIEGLKNAHIDLIIIQIGTYSFGNSMLKITERLAGVPIFLWSFPEPIVEGYDTIPLNSLCGLNMYSSFLKKIKVDFSYAYGEVDDEKTLLKIENTIEALKVKKILKNSKFCIIGGRVPGFYLSNVDELRFRHEIGVEIDYYSLAALLVDAENISEDRVEEEVSKMYGEAKISTLPEMIEKTARVQLAIEDFKNTNNIDAFAIKCWPDFQSIYNFAPCGVVSRLTNGGTMVSCEGDITGLATMYIEHLFTNKPPFLTDLVNINYNGVLKAWHCGPAASDLADGGEIEYSMHPTIKDDIGMSVQFTMQKGPLVMAKLSEGEDKYKLFFVKGEGVEVDREIKGSQADIKLNSDSVDVLDTIINEGIEHHYSIIYEDISDKLLELCKWMKLKPIVCKDKHTYTEVD